MSGEPRPSLGRGPVQTPRETERCHEERCQRTEPDHQLHRDANNELWVLITIEREDHDRTV